MAPKVHLITLEGITMTDGKKLDAVSLKDGSTLAIKKQDNSAILTRSSATEMADGSIKVVQGSIRNTLGNEDLLVRFVVDTELDKKAQLVVPPTHVAMLVKDGNLLQTLEGGKYFIYDKKNDMSGWFIKKFTTDSVHIIYINKTAKMRMPWGTPNKLDLRDPLTDIPVKVSVCGEFEVRVGDPRKFYLEVVAMDRSYDIERLQERLLNKLMSRFQPEFARTMREKKITYNLVDEYTGVIADNTKPELKLILKEDYGVDMFDFFIKKITIDESTKAQIEAILKTEKDEKKEEAKKYERKLELKEELAELERLADKEWEKRKYLLELEGRDYARYLEVCEAIGWESSNKSQPKAPPKPICAKCNADLIPGNKFCGKCGTPSDGKIKCLGCGKELKLDDAFCGGCGKGVK